MICSPRSCLIFLVVLAIFPILQSNASTLSTSTSEFQDQTTIASSALPGETKIETAQVSFAAIRAKLQEVDNWDDLLKDIDLVVRKFGNDPTVKIQALELLAQVLPAAPYRLKSREARSWGDFSVEYSRQLATLPFANGTQQPEPAFRTYNSLRILAEMLEDNDANGSKSLLLAIGEIGRRLHANPAYPREAVAGLAPMLMAEAHGHALTGGGARAQDSIQLALEWGLVDFEDIYEDHALVSCSTGGSIRTLVGNRQKIYSEQVRTGVVSAVGQFKPFAFDFSLPSLHAGRITKSHYSDKLTVVDIWGTWCNPCRASIPHLIRLQDQFADKGVRVVGIAMEQEPTVEEIQTKLAQFSEEHGITYDLLVGNDAILEQIPGQSSLPTLVFLDSTGRVLFATSGYRDYTQLRIIVETLLEMPPTVSR